ncbi:helix-hairpin-helix domain-containing protein [Nocardioides sp. W3-2-3]|nr:helix-hairpin-helix domain-containing protein [Nocardioides convexus]
MTAQAIIAFREQRGGFTSVEEPVGGRWHRGEDAGPPHAVRDGVSGGRPRSRTASPAPSRPACAPPRGRRLVGGPRRGPPGPHWLAARRAARADHRRARHPPGPLPAGRAPGGHRRPRRGAPAPPGRHDQPAARAWRRARDGAGGGDRRLRPTTRQGAVG